MDKFLTIDPINKVNGIVNLQGSKSISNRVLLLASCSLGITRINNLLYSEDTIYMLSALKKIGVKYKLSKNNTCCIIYGKTELFFTKKNVNLFLGNAGTVIRPFCAFFSINKNNVILSGNSRMNNRPIGSLVDALLQGGAKISYLGKKKYPPVKILGGYIGGKIFLNSSLSSQFLTSILMMAPLAKKDSEIFVEGLVSKPYIDMTLYLMKIFGINVYHDGYKKFYISGNSNYISPKIFNVEGDASNASYFLSAAAIKGGIVKVYGIGKKSIQGDIKYVNVLRKMGADIKLKKNFIECKRKKLKSINFDANDIPDAAMTLAVTALFVKNGITIIRNIYNWRIKETDRIVAMANELRKVGAFVTEGKDYLEIISPKILRSAEINTYNDHRMAMCFSLIALSGIPVTILNPQCVSKTFPNYFDIFSEISI